MKRYLQRGYRYAFPQDAIGRIMQRDLSRQRFLDPSDMANTGPNHRAAHARAAALPKEQRETFAALAEDWSGSLEQLFDTVGRLA
jgi:hypothetical protein